jgi:hypothetical protein
MTSYSLPEAAADVTRGILSAYWATIRSASGAAWRRKVNV